MTLRDRIAIALATASNPNTWPRWYVEADAVLAALPCTLSQLEMIERGEVVVVSAGDEIKRLHDELARAEEEISVLTANWREAEDELRQERPKG